MKKYIKRDTSDRQVDLGKWSPSIIHWGEQKVRIPCSFMTLGLSHHLLDLSFKTYLKITPKFNYEHQKSQEVRPQPPTTSSPTNPQPLQGSWGPQATTAGSISKEPMGREPRIPRPGQWGEGQSLKEFSTRSAPGIYSGKVTSLWITSSPSKPPKTTVHKIGHKVGLNEYHTGQLPIQDKSSERTFEKSLHIHPLKPKASWYHLHPFSFLSDV